jgi:hypothetical protein
MAWRPPFVPFRKLPEPGVDIEILVKDVRLDPPY